MVYKGATVLATYPVAIGFNGAAPKRMRGDDITPIGRYHIGWVSRDTRYGPFMGLTYPNRKNAAWGLREGIITRTQYRAIVAAVDAGHTPPQNTPLGGEIGIHGMGPHFADGPQGKVFPGRWTAGCVALSNWDARQIAAMVQVGTPVEIVGDVRGFRRNLESVSADARYKSAAVLNTRATPGAVAKPQDTAMDTLVAALAPTTTH
jgi:murein L,D-transpeptidase YafK